MDIVLFIKVCLNASLIISYEQAFMNFINTYVYVCAVIVITLHFCASLSFDNMLIKRCMLCTTSRFDQHNSNSSM